MINKKISSTFGILVILIIAVALGIVFYLSGNIETDINPEIKTTIQSNNEKNDWIEYKNEEYGFKLSHPKDYEAKMIKEMTFGFGPNNFTAPLPLSIDVYKSTPPAGLDDYIKNKMKNLIIKDCEKTTLDNKPAYECLDLGMITFYQITSENNGYIYELIFNTGNKDTLTGSKEALDENQESILSSFEFIK